MRHRLAELQWNCNLNLEKFSAAREDSVYHVLHVLWQVHTTFISLSSDAALPRYTNSYVVDYCNPIFAQFSPSAFGQFQTPCLMAAVL